ncbi:hypothetical protein TNCV_4090821 [Trichonephila clavipes]|nr:hypothetical protein TNCV_4090821 [Trichonephila clavipes]
MPSTSGYNLRPRKGTKVESRPTIKMLKHNKSEDWLQNSKSRGTTGLTSKNRSKVSQQNTIKKKLSITNCQERKGGANSNQSISLEVLVGYVNYKS